MKKPLYSWVRPWARRWARPWARLALAQLAFAALVLLGCSGQWSFDESWSFEFGDDTERGPRPAETSTPRPGDSRPLALPRPTTGVARPLPHEADPVPTPNLAQLDTAAQLAHVIVPPRDLRELALRLDPDLDAIPLVANEHTPDYALGEELNFWVHNLDTGQNVEISAELVHKTDVAYAWVERGRTVNRAALMQAVDAFSTQAYPPLVEFFGSEWNPGVDNDPRVHILHSAQVGAGIAGYYSSSDQYSRLANPTSNEKEMFYINLSIVPTGNADMLYYETVLAHEFQHMIHWHQDRNEETWLNEGLSEYAQEVAGYPADNEFTGAFANRPQTQLNTWSEEQGGNAPHYGAAYLLVNYFTQRFGEDRTRALVASPTNGIQGFNQVLDEIGAGTADGYGFDGLFADWVVANYAEDPYALGCGSERGCVGPEDARYGYLGLEQLAPALHARHAAYPVDPPSVDLPNYATHYILLEGDAADSTGTVTDVVFHFLGEVDTVLARTDWQTTAAGPARAWWSNRGDDLNPRLTRAFDLRDLPPGTPVELLARMWWEIETDYDYGYIVASTDGENWDILPGTYTSATNGRGDGGNDPTGEVSTGASFGPGYTGRSIELTGTDASTDAGWVVESVDLSPYVGQEVWVRFEYVTDDAVNASGWFVDSVQIPALDYAEDFATSDGGWQSEGWLLTDNRLDQRWLLQVLHLEANRLVELERYTPDAEGRIVVPIAGLGGDHSAVIAISPLTPVTTVPAPYTYHIERE
ncbi:MAG: hypothetical protein WDZ49_01125 [Litorilinea sp.]